MKNVISRTTGIENGTYGPQHDPYAYTEYRMNTKYGDGTEMSIVVHMGLAIWCEINGSDKVRFMEDEYLSWLTPMGLTIRELIDCVIIAKNRRTEKCPECGSREVYGQDGFPGEYLYICSKCKTVCDCDFDLSAVA